MVGCVTRGVLGGVQLSVCFGESVQAVVAAEKRSFFGSGTMEVRSHDDQLVRVEHGACLTS